jgi:hypothetical protein
VSDLSLRHRTGGALHGDALPARVPPALPAAVVPAQARVSRVPRPRASAPKRRHGRKD